MSVTIYHNPRCSKSRETLQLLNDRGIRPTVIEYLKTPPSVAELKRIIKMLGIPARELLRSKEPEYSAVKLDNPRLSDDTLIGAMFKHPVLIERPIVISGNKAAIGRPPERVLSILARISQRGRDSVADARRRSTRKWAAGDAKRIVQAR